MFYKEVELSDAQLKAEMDKCEYCEEKPCQEACPAHCSPADFIMAAKHFEDRDFERASAIILGSNPLGGICGYTCPDYHCMKACVHKNFDKAVNIPAVQSGIIRRARQAFREPIFFNEIDNGKKVLIIGGGPSGLACSSVLAQKGYQITLVEKEKKLGGMTRLIPSFRLPEDMLDMDLDFFMELGLIKVVCNKEVELDKELIKEFDAVVLANGLDEVNDMTIPGSEWLIPWDEFLKSPGIFALKGKRIAVIGGGAIAADIATVALNRKVDEVEMIALEKLSELPLTEREFDDIKNSDVVIHQRTKVIKVTRTTQDKYDLDCYKVELPKKMKFHPAKLTELLGTQSKLRGFDLVFLAIGSKSSVKRIKNEKVFYTGDMISRASTIVEAVASGKNTALLVDAFINKMPVPVIENQMKSQVCLSGKNMEPVSLETTFFGRKISSPFILSAAPPTDGYDQMKKAYQAGWAGGIMKTAFDDLDIHIPSQYMFLLNKDTYANCDNVSGHTLKRVCDEIKQLVHEFPDHLTMASTGGPVSGNDKEDKKVWQSNTKMLEKAGVMGIEYSLSCPQGGDGTQGDIVSQDADLTAKIINWVMEISDPEIPKLFKLTGAVTAIQPILIAIQEVFKKYPNKKAGVTLANSFPALLFRESDPAVKKNWLEGVVVGLSGDGVTPISNLSLAKASSLNMHISANGGPMDYLSAANFLAMGAETVQFCTIVMKYGYHIIDELKSGLSYLLAEKNLSNVDELIGMAKPNIITDFMDLSPVKGISDVVDELCQHCGNCTRCPYQAIELDENKIPRTDPKKCIGCSICVQKCFASALYMRERLADERGEE